jgi:hypothetical protein
MSHIGLHGDLPEKVCRLPETSLYMYFSKRKERIGLQGEEKPLRHAEKGKNGCVPESLGLLCFPRFPITINHAFINLIERAT